MAGCKESERFEPVRRRAGDRGGVKVPVPLIELNEAFLFKLGVPDLEAEPSEFDDGDLRNIAGECGTLSLSNLSAGVAIGEEGGSSVFIAVPRHMRFIVAESVKAPLFVDLGIGKDGSAARSWFLASSMNVAPLQRAHLKI